MDQPNRDEKLFCGFGAHYNSMECGPTFNTPIPTLFTIYYIFQSIWKKKKFDKNNFNFNF